MSIVTGAIVLVCMLLAVTVTLAAAWIRILREYERAVVFRLVRLVGDKGPGADPAHPRYRSDGAGAPAHGTLDVPPQNLITRANVPAKVNAVCWFRVRLSHKSATAARRCRILQPRRDVAGGADVDLAPRRWRPRRVRDHVRVLSNAADLCDSLASLPPRARSSPWSATSGTSQIAQTTLRSILGRASPRRR
jgi:regulator of protease activity HflC (stomatin/prohibitin superfamily)